MPKPDADTKAVLRDLSVTPLVRGAADLAEVRQAYDQVFAGWTAPSLQPTNETWMSDCGLGGDRQALIIEPANGKTGESSLVLIHGGGWSLGNALCYAPLGRLISGKTGRRVIVPDFPQAPEDPAPAALGALSAFLPWVSDRYANDLVLIGDSAGGTLAAILSNRPPEGVSIRAQVLLYPVIDLRPDAAYGSRKRYGQGKHFLTADGIVGAALQYCGPLQSAGSPQVTPLLETEFARTPPTLIMVPELDPLFDECLAYEAQLRAHGIETELLIAKRTIHGCVSFSGRIASGLAAIGDVCVYITNRLRESAPGGKSP